MLRRTLFVLSLFSVAILIGCSAETTNNSNTTGNTNTATTTTNSATSTSTTTASTGDKIGIAECDDFIAKYEACVTKHVPEAQRSTYESTLKQWKDSWKSLAANAATKGTLTSVCKQAAEQQKTAMKSWGCDF